MIIFPSFTTIMFSLKLTFALFMVCLLHFYIFIPNSAQTLCQLSKALLQIFRCFLFFKKFHPPTESSPRASGLFSPPAALLSSWDLPSPSAQVFSMYHFCVTAPVTSASFFLFCCLVLEGYFLQQLPEEVCPGGQYVEYLHSQPLTK